MNKSRYETQLREKINKHFDDEELRTLCQDLGIAYDDLPARGKANKARELVGFLERNGRLPELITLCRQKHPRVAWPARFFIGYNSHVEPDKTLAATLRQFLGDHGHHAFIDKTIRAGTDWLDEIDWQIQTADFVIVLLSQVSADSEMVQGEIQRAYKYRRQRGYPRILPVRINYEGMLPYAIDYFLDATQYTVWRNEADNQRLGEEILAALNGRLPDRPPVEFNLQQPGLSVSEDGRLLTSNTPQPPLPEADPRILAELDAPGGTVRLEDKFYVARNADQSLKRQLDRPGSIATIRAPRQTGKSSLLIRGNQHARQQGAQVIHLDLQRVGYDCLDNLDTFLRYLANFIVRKLRLDRNLIQKMWGSDLGDLDRLTYFMEDHVLSAADQPIILALDEADRLLVTDFHTDFFGLLRFWHNNAADDELWEKLKIVLVISTEHHLLVADPNMSPFNVGLKINLEDFNIIQVQGLNKLHNSPVAPGNLSAFMQLLNGNPYLTRKALYALVFNQLSWDQFIATAPTDKGPFSDHLRRLLWLLRDEPELQAALKQVVRHQRCPDQETRYRLQRAGLIQTAGDVCTCRCDLYQRYFERKL